jgi:hypothetical protein
MHTKFEMKITKRSKKKTLRNNVKIEATSKLWYISIVAIDMFVVQKYLQAWYDLCIFTITKFALPFGNG